jgi:uncharacterized protein involved in cysteine biosynthesis
MKTKTLKKLFATVIIIIICLLLALIPGFGWVLDGVGAFCLWQIWILDTWFNDEL